MKSLFLVLVMLLTSMAYSFTQVTNFELEVAPTADVILIDQIDHSIDYVSSHQSNDNIYKFTIDEPRTFEVFTGFGTTYEFIVTPQERTKNNYLYLEPQQDMIIWRFNYSELNPFDQPPEVTIIF